MILWQNDIIAFVSFRPHDYNTFLFTRNNNTTQNTHTGAAMPSYYCALANLRDPSPPVSSFDYNTAGTCAYIMCTRNDIGRVFVPIARGVWLAECPRLAMRETYGSANVLRGDVFHYNNTTHNARLLLLIIIISIR